jgi:excisionase family DNA binding protein
MSAAEQAELEKEWITYREAQKFSGLGRTTLWKLLSSGEIKAARVGRSVRIHLPTLREFMEAASAKAVGEENRPSTTAARTPSVRNVRR